jgi:hypothetical protein
LRDGKIQPQIEKEVLLRIAADPVRQKQKVVAKTGVLEMAVLSMKLHAERNSATGGSRADEGVRPTLASSFILATLAGLSF